MVWNKSENSPADSKDRPDIDTAIRELKDKIEEGIERNLRLEDQLWGIMDKLKEQEQNFKQFKNDFFSIGQPEDNMETESISSDGSPDETDSPKDISDVLNPRPSGLDIIEEPEE